MTMHDLGGKYWLSQDTEFSLGDKRARLLLAIEETGSLAKAVKKLKMSYRHAWGMLKALEDSLSSPLIQSLTGGTRGGRTALTPFGKRLLKNYVMKTEALRQVANDDSYWEDVALKLSARNSLAARVETMVLDGNTAKITLSVSRPTRLTSLITREAAEELGLKKGSRVKAIVKSTEVLIGVEKSRARKARRRSTTGSAARAKASRN
ncbi:MAG: LysR family transcriptional regulator [Euryarchaeota archaeon]|nr:LysR family transcriptional regulator [Euryarchaeota archaeon]